MKNEIEIVREAKAKKPNRITKALDDAYWACWRGIRDLVSPVWYRFFGYKHHIVNTELKPCSWIDTDTRMLYAVMALVKWFVENNMRIWSKKDYENELKRIKEKVGDEYRDYELKSMTDQYEGDQKIIGIHKWWKNYDKRQEEIDEARNQWHDYIASFQADKEDFMSFFNVEREKMNKVQRAKAKKLLDVLDNLEKKLADEEQEMLKLAVELRGRMWS